MQISGLLLLLFLTGVISTSAPVHAAEDVHVTTVRADTGGVQKCARLLMTTSRGKAWLQAALAGGTRAVGSFFESFLTGVAQKAALAPIAVMNPAVGGVVAATTAAGGTADAIEAGLDGVEEALASLQASFASFRVFRVTKADGTRLDIVFEAEESRRAFRHLLKRVRSFAQAAEEVEAGSTNESDVNPLSMRSRAVRAAGWLIALGTPTAMHVYPDFEGVWGGNLSEVGISFLSFVGGLTISRMANRVSSGEARDVTHTVVDEIIHEYGESRVIVVYAVREREGYYLDAIRSLEGVEEVESDQYLAELLAEELDESGEAGGSKSETIARIRVVLGTVRSVTDVSGGVRAVVGQRERVMDLVSGARGRLGGIARGFGGRLKFWGRGGIGDSRD